MYIYITDSHTITYTRSSRLRGDASQFGRNLSAGLQHPPVFRSRSRARARASLYIIRWLGSSSSYQPHPRSPAMSAVRLVQDCWTTDPFLGLRYEVGIRVLHGSPLCIVLLRDGKSSENSALSTSPVSVDGRCSPFARLLAPRRPSR